MGVARGETSSKSRKGIWIALILLPIGLVVLGVPSLWVYMTVTAKPIHPNPAKAPAVTQSTPSPKWAGPVDQAREAARAHLSEKNLPGLSVAVGIGGDIVWAEGFGFADLDTRLPVAPNHKFRIGTASVALTSAAVGLLLEDGRLKLDDPIQKHVPAFPQQQWPVTLRQLMGHLAGVPSDDGDEGPLYGKHCEQRSTPSRRSREPAALQPGTRFQYSSYGWILVSAAVEAAAHGPYVSLPAGARV